MRAFKLVAFLCAYSVAMILWYKFRVNKLDTGFDGSFIMIDESIKDSNITDDRSVFFVETHTTYFHEIDSHQACSIESAGGLL